MNLKQQNIQVNLEPSKNHAYVKNKSIKSVSQSSITTQSNKESANDFLLRLQEVEKINVNLESIVDQRTKKLNEVVETNHKFMSIIAHDLRSPFTLILAALDLLKKKLEQYKINDLETYINISADSAKRTLDLLDNLLAWAISQSGDRNFNPVKINLNELLLDEIKSVKALAIQKQININFLITPNLNVSADLHMAKVIIRNLISNALKFTNTNGEITISASESDQFVAIAIKDNGIGIAPEAQKKLFRIDSFHSTEGTGGEKGTGFGLLLCKEFVEIHGGKIWIESKPNKGSEFKFTLPHYI